MERRICPSVNTGDYPSDVDVMVIKLSTRPLEMRLYTAVILPADYTANMQRNAVSFLASSDFFSFFLSEYKKM